MVDLSIRLAPAFAPGTLACTHLFTETESCEKERISTLALSSSYTAKYRDFDMVRCMSRHKCAFSFQMQITFKDDAVLVMKEL